MTFAELRAEFRHRGYDHIETARVNLWLNQAYLELCEERNWPFVEATNSAVMPQTITDLRQVLSVADTTNGNVLKWADRRDVVARDPDLSETGTADTWFFDGAVIRVHPANTTATHSVRYLKVPAELSADADAPVVPARFQDLIVDGAVYRALKDNDEYDSAIALRDIWEIGVQKMADSQLMRNYDSPDFIIVTRTS